MVTGLVFRASLSVYRQAAGENVCCERLLLLLWVGVRVEKGQDVEETCE